MSCCVEDKGGRFKGPLFVHRTPLLLLLSGARLVPLRSSSVGDSTPVSNINLRLIHNTSIFIVGTAPTIQVWHVQLYLLY